MKKPYHSKLLSLLVISASLSLTFIYCNKGLNSDLKTVEQSEMVTPNNVPPYCDDLPNPCDDPACARYYFCDPPDITVVYAGVPITYETGSNMLRFNSTTDFRTVVDQLEAALETYNNNYENQYASLTPEELDAVDEANGFDEFKPLRDFEASLGFVSKRRAIELAENTWMAADMTGTDPDDIDRTFDDELNTLCNSNYQVKIGGTVYTMTADNIPVAVAANGTASVLVVNPCVTNKKKKIRVTSPDGSRRFKLKVAINTWHVRSGVKGKVVSYKKKSNGKWKRSRTRLAVYNGGTVYNSGCSLSAQLSLRKPSSGYKKRKQLKNVYRGYGVTYTTKYGELYASFDAQNIMTGDVVLQ